MSVMCMFVWECIGGQLVFDQVMYLVAGLDIQGLSGCPVRKCGLLAQVDPVSPVLLSIYLDHVAAWCCFASDYTGRPVTVWGLWMTLHPVRLSYGEVW